MTDALGKPGLQEFGGDWTEQKLAVLGKYMRAYTTIMRAQRFSNGQRFEFEYVDAFAGTGYRQTKQTRVGPTGNLFPEYAREEEEYLKGSAAIALDCEPPFPKCTFVENDADRAAELQRLVESHPRRATARVLNQDANDFLEHIGRMRWPWNARVLAFVDPYAMQVRWSVIEALGRTKKVDLWLLVPIAAINRCLQRDGRISEGLCRRLDVFFGTSDWAKELYTQRTSNRAQGSLFEDEAPAEAALEKVSWKDVGAYIRRRLQISFAHVPPPGALKCRNSPLFLLCFASANRTGEKIAKDLLRGLEQTG